MILAVLEAPGSSRAIAIQTSVLGGTQVVMCTLVACFRSSRTSTPDHCTPGPPSRAWESVGGASENQL